MKFGRDGRAIPSVSKNWFGFMPGKLMKEFREDRKVYTWFY